MGTQRMQDTPKRVYQVDRTSLSLESLSYLTSGPIWIPDIIISKRPNQHWTSDDSSDLREILLLK